MIMMITVITIAKIIKIINKTRASVSRLPSHLYCFSLFVWGSSSTPYQLSWENIWFNPSEVTLESSPDWWLNLAKSLQKGREVTQQNLIWISNNHVSEYLEHLVVQQNLICNFQNTAIDLWNVQFSWNMVKIFFFLRKEPAWAIALVITLFISYHPLAGTNPNLFRNLFKAGHCCRYLSGTLLYNTLVLKMRPCLTLPGVAALDLGNGNFGTIHGKLIGLSDYIYQCKSISMIM